MDSASLRILASLRENGYSAQKTQRSAKMQRHERRFLSLGFLRRSQVFGTQFADLRLGIWGIFLPDRIIKQLNPLLDWRNVLCTYKQVKLSLRC